MSNEDAIKQLKDLSDKSISLLKNFKAVYKNGEDKERENEIKALNMAIEALKQNENLVNQVAYFLQRAVNAEILLRGIQPFCQETEENLISEFFKNINK